MHLMLLAAGALALLAGVGALLFGAANYAPGVGNTMLLAGTNAIIGGAILAGLGAILSRLRRIHDTLESQKVPREIVPVADDAAPTPAAGFGGRVDPRAGERPTPPTPPHVEEAVPQRFAAPPSPVQPPAEAARPAVAREPVVPLGNTGAAAAQTTKVDAASRADWPRVEAPQPPLIVRADGSVSTDVEPREPHPASADGSAATPPPEPPPAAPPLPTPAGSAAVRDFPAVLKSGVVEGMAYTLYEDGSIEAEMPGGTMRFNSIAELRAHLRDHASPG